MKCVYCDVCNGRFHYGEETEKTDGTFKSVALGDITARVQLTVRALHPTTGEHADICPTCRQKAIAKLISIQDHNESQRHKLPA